MSISEVKIKNDSGEELYSLREPGIVSFGRDKKVCHITFDPKAARVSRVHASLEWNDEGVSLVDKSKEGTFINGRKIRESRKNLEEGTYQLDIGGTSMSVEIVATELDETIADSPNTPNAFKIPEPVIVDSAATKVLKNTRRMVAPVVPAEFDDDFSDVSSISTFGIPKHKSTLKRKSDATGFEESQPRGKKGASRSIDFDEEMENRVKKGPRARKAAESVIFEEEMPAKKIKTIEEKPELLGSQRFINAPKVEEDVEMESIVTQVAALPSASHGPAEVSIHNRSEMDRIDRGPSAHNETIKYTNLIFRQPDFSANNSTRIDPNVPNFKRFIPKGQRGDGRTSAASMYSHNNTTFNATIRMIDSRRMQ